MRAPVEKMWFAVYTKSRAEKKVLAELQYLGIDCYLPLLKKLRQWSDRKKWVEVPLISGYIFVHISPKEYDLVLKITGVVTYVRFEGKAAIIPQTEIDNIKLLLRQTEIDIEISNQLFDKGDSIEVIAGPLMGMKGTIVEFKGKKRVALQINQLNLSLLINLPINEIAKRK